MRLWVRSEEFVACPGCGELHLVSASGQNVEGMCSDIPQRSITCDCRFKFLDFEVGTKIVRAFHAIFLGWEREMIVNNWNCQSAGVFFAHYKDGWFWGWDSPSVQEADEIEVADRTRHTYRGCEKWRDGKPI